MADNGTETGTTGPEPGTTGPNRSGSANSGKKSVYPSRTGNGPVPDQTGNRVPTVIIKKKFY
ncbi:hypothetical protein KY285_007124 [Solanum tuberosum]|nr:hypothetical protein KY289_007523 [Solanum tuberosum]KAH0745467.1 hypothetical protein KY285_007124 [Solanum tuberosum]